MKNFIFKSTEADLQKMFQYLETIQKNVLYLTYRIDTILKTVTKLGVDAGLQRQVDEYFDDSGESADADPPILDDKNGPTEDSH